MKHSVKEKPSAIMPVEVKPMLCTLIKKPFNDPAYLYEVKWDGYRIIGHLSDTKAKLVSRGGHDYTRKYPSIVKALRSLQRNLIVDGEVVYVNTAGKPDFDALQSVNGNNAPLVYYVFDILWLDDENLMNLPLTRRKQILKSVIPEESVIKFSDDFDDGELLFRHVTDVGLEGIIAKQRNSPYLPNDRSKRWYKISTDIKEEFVIGGWTESEADRHFRTLMFGNYRDGKLIWVGHAGGGYKENEMPKILKKLKAIEIGYCPFENEVDYKGIAHWVQPKFVANIKYARLTKTGRIRKPAIFLGFRNDKNATDVIRQAPENVT